METLVIRVENHESAMKLRKVLNLFRGVVEVSEHLTEKEMETLENKNMIKSIRRGLKTKSVSREEVFKYLD
ncbi:hypothetical protein FACS1894155_00720 [Bacteroidia bacterium]|nr:hypothetical protein FACS189455_3970 [Bacteroidia bacterium]GHU87541.1 hypothetical protein FACS1894155_00720 [Bacteroidia bacterium]